MISLYESILSGMDDIIDVGDNIVDDIVINGENSILKQIFPGNTIEKPFEIEGSKDYKILSVKGRGQWAYCEAGNISEVITNVKELKKYGPLHIAAEDGLDGNSIKDSLCETIIAPSISVHNAININGVNFIVKKLVDYGIPLIQFSNKTKKLTNCSIEVEPRTNFTSKAMFTSIPEFKNVTSNTVEELHIRWSTSGFAYNVKDFTASIMSNTDLSGLFEFGYELNYKNGAGDDKKIKVKDLATLRKMTLARDSSMRVYSEWPIKLKTNAKLSDLIDVSGFKNLRTVTISDDKFGIMFENINHPDSQKDLQKYHTAHTQVYCMLKDKPVVISSKNKDAMNEAIDKIPVTKDGWRVMLCKL